jgi:hypothetical protein
MAGRGPAPKSNAVRRTHHRPTDPEGGYLFPGKKAKVINDDTHREHSRQGQVGRACPVDGGRACGCHERAGATPPSGAYSAARRLSSALMRSASASWSSRMTMRQAASSAVPSSTISRTLAARRS